MNFQLDVGFADYCQYDVKELLICDLLTTKSKTKIPVFFYRHPEATQTILFSHGNAADCGIMSTLYILICSRLKVNILAYDYTGYGVSMHFGVRPTEKQTYKDIQRVYQWALDENFIKDPQKELIVYGQSVGSGPSCYFAAKHRVAGLILHSPILSGLRVITDSRAFGCFDIFPNIDRIPSVDCPVFVIHGERDQEVSVLHGKGLHQAGKNRNCLQLVFTYFISYFCSFSTRKASILTVVGTGSWS
jgi:pimeloyl-ACP methyl ester carboxylesterase